MSNKIEIIQREVEDTLEVAVNVPMWKMPFKMNKIYKQIIKHLEDSETKFSSAPYARYLEINWTKLNNESKLSAFVKMFTRKWKLKIGFPVDKKITGSGNIESGVIPAGSYVKTIHRGTYQKVAETYNRMLTWTDQQEIAVKNESIEIYLNDPRTTKMEDLETIVLIPVAR